eukprot:s283_g20.t1
MRIQSFSRDPPFLGFMLGPKAVNHDVHDHPAKDGQQLLRGSGVHSDNDSLHHPRSLWSCPNGVKRELVRHHAHSCAAVAISSAHHGVQHGPHLDAPSDQKAMAELRLLRLQGVQVNAFHYTRCLGSNWEEASNLLIDLALHAVPRDIYCFNGAANLSGKANRWLQALGLLRTARRANFQWDEYSLGILSHALRDHRWQAAVHVVSKGEGLYFAERHVSSSFALNAMATASKWQCLLSCDATSTLEANLALRMGSDLWQLSMAKFWQMPGLRLLPDLSTFNTLLSCSPWCRGLDLAQLQDLALRPDSVTFNTASTAAAQAQCWRTGLRLLPGVLQHASAGPSALVSALSAWNAWSWAGQLFREVEQLALEIDAPFATATSTLITGAGRWPLSLHLVAAGSQDPLQRNAQLTALATARRWPSALRLVQKAWAQRWRTDDYGCSQVVDAIGQCKQWPSALDTIMKAGAPPYALNSFMTSIFSVWRCVLFLAAAGVITCISAVLSTLVSRCGTWRQGLYFWHPNSQGSNSACNAVISLLQDDQQWQRAAWCLELMGAKHLEADELSKSSVMNHRLFAVVVAVAGVDEGSPPRISPGDVIEAKVYDDTGKHQGEILVGVLRLASKYKGGDVIEGRFLGASDLYYHWWMNDGEGAPNQARGWYHLCSVATKDCPTTTKYKNMVHSDRYRNLGPKAPTAKKVPWLSDATLYGACMDKFKMFQAALGKTEPEKPPMKAPPGRASAAWAGDESDPGSEETGETSSADESSEDRGMKAKISDLRAQLKKAEGEAHDRKKRQRAMKKRGDPAKGEKKEKKEKKRRGDPGTPGEKPRKRDEGDLTKHKKKKKKKPVHSSSEDEAKRKKKASSDSERPVKKKRKKPEEDEGADDESSAAGALFVAKKEAAKGDGNRERDRGPFGDGTPVDFSDGDTSDDDESVFQKGSTAPAKSSQQRLLRYARKYPGRLASRLLLKMQEGTARGAVGPTGEKERRTPVVALNYILTILLPALGQKAGVRSTRELKTLGTIMDQLAAGSPSKAADVVAQRIKALERATQEGHWGAAQFLELLAPEGTLLLDRSEESFLAREYLLDQKLRNYTTRARGVATEKPRAKEKKAPARKERGRREERRGEPDGTRQTPRRTSRSEGGGR